MGLFAPGLFAPGLFSAGLFSGDSLNYFTVADFLTDLFADELSDMYAGNRNTRKDARIKILPLMNTALLQIYAKYQIEFNTAEVNVVSTRTTYILPQRDILGVVRVINAYGRELRTDEVKVLGKTLVFACPKDVTVQVEYKVRPPRMTVDQFDAGTHLKIPDILLSWMRAEVASRLFRAQKTESAIAKSAELSAQAQMWTDLYEGTNTSNEFTSEESCRFTAKGFM